MREIKFRAWDKDRKKMIGPFHVGSMLAEYRPPEMQYTDLKDRNGKEIYEGDIIVFDESMPIEMDRGCWTCKRKGKASMLLFGVNEQSEVIGNIYENPELLDEKG
jgi:hypothetical protein